MEYKDEQQDYTVVQLMLLAENKYKSLKQSGEWGKVLDEEAEIVALNTKIKVLKHKGTKKPERKLKKEEKKQQDEGKKDNEKKQEKKKEDFCWQKTKQIKQKGQLKGKSIFGVLIMSVTNPKTVKTRNTTSQVKKKPAQQLSNPM